MAKEEIRPARSTNPAGSEFFNTLQEMRRDWMARATAEIELSLKLSKKLEAAGSVPDALAAYQEWLNTSADVQWAKIHGRHLSIPVEWLDKRRHDHLALERVYWLQRRNEQWQRLLAA
jgi:hypothetical protein